MIQAVRLENLAIIDALEVNFRSGFTVITGETGSGKSLLLLAIALTLGQSASPKKTLKHGTSKGFVELDLELTNPAIREPVQALFARYELDLNTDELLLIRREFTEKSSRCRINGTPVPKECLEQLAPLWADMHSQHELSSLLNSDAHHRYLDGSGDENFAQLLNTYQQRYRAWRSVVNQLDSLKNKQAQAERERDFQQFQYTELTDAAIENVDEDTMLKAELDRLQQSENLIKACQKGQNLLIGDSDGGPKNLIDQLGELSRVWQPFKQLDETTSEWYDTINEHLEGLRELANAMSRYEENCGTEPTAIDAMVERLDVLEKMKRKYGATLTEVLAFYEQLTATLNESIYAEEALNALIAEEALLQTDVRELAEVLHTERTTLAHHLNKQITAELRELALPSARFEVNLTEKSLGETGYDKVRFGFSANPGEPLKPLEDVASGGELSRVMLAIKVVLAGQMTGKTLVFDEIDTGVSGETTKKVAQRLRRLAEANQVMTITHQPLVAVAAQQHLYVSKLILPNEQIHVQADYLAMGSEHHRQVLAQLTSGDMAHDVVDNYVKTLLSEAAERVG